MKINLLTVCVDQYPMLYVEKLVKHFSELTDFEVTAYAITDRPDQLSDAIIPISPKVTVDGWWNKVLLFDPELPDGWNIYLDLDIVMFQNFDHEILYAIEQNRQVACVSDALHWHGEKFSSSMMIFKTGKMATIFEKFMKSYSELKDREGGDQVWVGPYLSDILYLDEKFPDLKRHFKFQFAIVENGQFHAPEKLPAEIKMIDFGGLPKPHQLSMVPYIKENWHLV